MPKTLNVYKLLAIAVSTAVLTSGALLSFTAPSTTTPVVSGLGALMSTLSITWLET